MWATKITDKEKEILKYLAEERKADRPVWYYELSEKEKIASNKTVLKALHRLEKVGLIEVKYAKQLGFMGRERNYYGLTLRGLAWLITNGEVQDNLDKVAENWGPLLPLVLGKWQFFKSAGLGEGLVKALKWLCGQVLSWGFDEGTIEGIMEQFFVYVFMLKDSQAKISWLKAFRKDRELWDWAIGKMGLWLAEAAEWWKINAKTLQLLEMPDEPDWDKAVGELRWHPLTEKEVSEIIKEVLEPEGP